MGYLPKYSTFTCSGKPLLETLSYQSLKPRIYTSSVTAAEQSDVLTISPQDLISIEGATVCVGLLIPFRSILLKLLRSIRLQISLSIFRKVGAVGIVNND